MRRPGPRTTAAVGVARTAASAVVALLAGLLLWSTLPLVLGWDPSVVMSSSMSPRLRPGDVVLTEPVGDRELRAGLVVRFDDPGRAGRPVLHRVQSVQADGSLVTRGDANPTPDVAPVDPSQVSGVARLRIPTVGLVAHLQRTGRHAELAGVVALLLVVGLLAASGPGPDARPRARHRATTTLPR